MLIGGTGTGKSHLAIAIAWFIAGPPPVRRLALASVTIRQPPLRRSVANTPLTCIERTPSSMALLSVVRRTGIHPHVAVEANSIAAIMEMVCVAGLATIFRKWCRRSRRVSALCLLPPQSIPAAWRCSSAATVIAAPLPAPLSLWHRIMREQWRIETNAG